MSSSTAASDSGSGPHLTLYFDPISQPSRAVLMFLRETGLAHEVRSVSLEKREQFAPQFLAINPLHRIPTIVEAATHSGSHKASASGVESDSPDFVLDESMTIMRYLVSSRPSVPRHWFPSSPRLQARVNQYLDWHHINFRRPAGITVFMSLFRERAGATEEKARSVIAELAQPLRDALGHIESRLQIQDWIATVEDISIADLSCATEVAQLSMILYDLSPYPRLSAWYDRVRQRVKSFDDVHQTVTMNRERVAKGELKKLE